jgi:SAM-dependent methyltransferase
MLARMAGERLPVVLDLTARIREPGSTWHAQGRRPPNYFERLVESRDAAREYTRMLYEMHLPLAEAVADELEIGDARRILDLGGGSGVVSMALLRRHASLRAVVADISNVCIAGREIAREQGLDHRLSFEATDFVRDALPQRCDLVLTCDTGPYSEALFRKIRTSLNGSGRFVMVEQFPGDAAGAALVPPWLTWSFRASLHDASFRPAALVDLQPLLEHAGLRVASTRLLPARKDIRWAKGWSIIEVVPVRQGADPPVRVRQVEAQP